MTENRFLNQVYFDENSESWDKRVALHEKSAFYDVNGFINGISSLTEIEQSELGEVLGKRLLHLQCHFGMDTLSLGRLGADCVGIDFSREAILKARSLNNQLGLNCSFYESNVYDILDLGLGLFDIVFTSYGTISWLPDLDQWAYVISKSLNKNGMFYFADFHPLLYLFDFNTKEIRYSYYNLNKPYTETETGSYADVNDQTVFKSHFWSHSIDEIIGVLLKNKLEIKQLNEIDYSPYNCFPNLSLIGKNRFRLELEHTRLPHVLLIKAIKK